MLGRLGVNVAELSAAKRYDDELMPLLGFTEFVSSHDEFAYRPGLTDDRIRGDSAHGVRISRDVRAHTDDSSGALGRAD